MPLNIMYLPQCGQRFSRKWKPKLEASNIIPDLEEMDNTTINHISLIDNIFYLHAMVKLEITCSIQIFIKKCRLLYFFKAFVLFSVYNICVLLDRFTSPRRYMFFFSVCLFIITQKVMDSFDEILRRGPETTDFNVGVDPTVTKGQIMESSLVTDS